MKPGSLSKKRLKKLEEDILVERNKLELSSKYRSDELENGGGEDAVLEKWDEELAQLTSKLRNLREKAPLGGDVSGLRAQIGEREDVIDELKVALKNRELELEEIGGKNSELESLIKESRQQYIAELKELKSELSAKDGEAAALKKSLEDSSKSLDQKIQLGERETEVLNGKIEGLERSLRSREREILEKEDLIKELKRLLRLKDSDLGGLEKRKGEIRTESVKTKVKLELELTNLRSEINAREVEVKNLKKELAESEDSLKRNVKANKNEVKSLKNGLSKLESALEDEERKLEMEMGLVRKLKGNLQERENELKELERSKNMIERQGREIKKGLEEELKRRRVELDIREREVQSLKKKLEIWHESIRGELDAAIEFITRQSEEISRLKAELEARDGGTEEDKLSYYRRRSRDLGF
jgi:chromosome segregation ATPase